MGDQPNRLTACDRMYVASAIMTGSQMIVLPFVADGTRHTNRIEDLDERLDRLVMIMRAMWALMEEQGMTPEQLMAKIENIDLEDGLVDGQVRPAPAECPSCQSKVAPGLRACQLCGTEVRPDTGHALGHV